MASVRYCLLLLFVIAIVVTQMACSWFYKRPDMELEAASAAISDSKKVCGDIYASDTYLAAQQKLDEANTAADNKDKSAKDLALQAKDLAVGAKEEAENWSESGQVRIATTLSMAQELLSEASELLGNMEDDEFTTAQLSTLSSLRDMEAKVDSMLNGPGCSLMDAESLVSRLLYESKGLVKGIKNEVQRREEEARRRVRTHTVVRGECLWVIAEYDGVYGDPFLWPLLYSANRSQIKDPDLIFPGQVFDVPFDTMARDRNDARKKAMTRGPWSLYDGE